MGRLSRTLRDLLDIRGVSQTRLADHLAVTRQAVSLYVNGKAEPSLDALVKIADLLDVSTDVLLGRRQFVRAKRKSCLPWCEHGKQQGQYMTVLL